MTADDRQEFLADHVDQRPQCRNVEAFAGHGQECALECGVESQMESCDCVWVWSVGRAEKEVCGQVTAPQPQGSPGQVVVAVAEERLAAAAAQEGSSESG